MYRATYLLGLVKEDILWLDVAVDHVPRVEVDEGPARKACCRIVAVVCARFDQWLTQRFDALAKLLCVYGRVRVAQPVNGGASVYGVGALHEGT